MTGVSQDEPHPKCPILAGQNKTQDETTEQDFRRISLENRGLEREVIFFTQDGRSGGPSADPANQPAHGYNRRIRRENAKKAVQLSKQQSAEARARELQRKKSEQRHLFKGQPFEKRPDPVTPNQIGSEAELRFMARVEQAELIRLKEKTSTTQEMIFECKAELLRLHAFKETLSDPLHHVMLQNHAKILETQNALHFFQSKFRSEAESEPRDDTHWPILDIAQLQITRAGNGWRQLSADEPTDHRAGCLMRPASDSPTSQAAGDQVRRDPMNETVLSSDDQSHVQVSKNAEERLTAVGFTVEAAMHTGHCGAVALTEAIEDVKGKILPPSDRSRKRALAKQRRKDKNRKEPRQPTVEHLGRSDAETPMVKTVTLQPSASSLTEEKQALGTQLSSEVTHRAIQSAVIGQIETKQCSGPLNVDGEDTKLIE